MKKTIFHFFLDFSYFWGLSLVGALLRIPKRGHGSLDSGGTEVLYSYCRMCWVQHVALVRKPLVPLASPYNSSGRIDGPTLNVKPVIRQ